MSGTSSAFDIVSLSFDFECDPSWTREELILALDAYFRYPDARGNKTLPKVAELSKVLNQLAYPGGG